MGDRVRGPFFCSGVPSVVLKRVVIPNPMIHFQFSTKNPHLPLSLDGRNCFSGHQIGARKYALES
jgi:hypothetical protein